MGKILFTSESVTEGHPDKICDQISDAILDAMLAQDPMSRVACETAVTTDLVLVMGEITSNATVDIEAIVRDTICKIGYDDAAKGFDGKTCQVKIALDKQSSDIAMGVDKALEAKLTDSEIESEGAGDQQTKPTMTICHIRFIWRTNCPASFPKSAKTERFPTCARTANHRSR